MARGHKNAYTDLTAEFIRSIFDYEAKTGKLLYKKPPSTFQKTGQQAGTLTKHGRIRLIIQGRHYYAHRIIWLWMTGSWPKFEVDHKDEDPSNNRWKNLRPATSSQNLSNRRAPINNTSGFKGVWKTRSGAWCAEIQFRKKRYKLGLFKTPEKAAEIYKKTAAKLHGNFAKT